MKAFRYPAGHLAGKTVTVKELRGFLATHPDDMPVIADWEGTCAYVDIGEAEVRRVSKGLEDDACDCLVFDVNTY